MAAMTRGEGAAPRHGEIGDIEIRHAGQSGLVGQMLQVMDEVGVTVIAQPFGADHLITRPFEGQGYAVFQATGGITTDGFFVCILCIGQKKVSIKACRTGCKWIGIQGFEIFRTPGKNHNRSNDWQ